MAVVGSVLQDLPHEAVFAQQSGQLRGYSICNRSIRGFFEGCSDQEGGSRGYCYSQLCITSIAYELLRLSIFIQLYTKSYDATALPPSFHIHYNYFPFSFPSLSLNHATVLLTASSIPHLGAYSNLALALSIQ